MFCTLKNIFSILKRVNFDTHLWCLSVLGGAILLCLSFFVEPSQRHFELHDDENALSVARQIVIEYSSVLGSLSNIETLEEDEVDSIVEAIPDYPEEDKDKAESEDKTDDTHFADYEGKDLSGFDLNIPTAGMVVSNDGDVNIDRVYTPESIDALERLVQCEAASEDADGRMLVADVVLNRVDTGIWGNDILSVIESPGQFKPVDNGAIKNAIVDQVTKDAVISAIVNDDIAKGAIYFQKSPQKVWGDKEYLFRHGSHSFYK